MLFAKFAEPIEFRCRPYEDVLSEVVVTHSPRYLIDMNLEEGQTIFDKINVPYDSLRKSENPIRPIVDYYKSKLKPGDELWWMDSENDMKHNNIVIRIWNNLTTVEKKYIINKSMAYFPELFSNSPEKFGRLSIWLITSEAIVCPNMRDQFTAGGKNDFTFDKIKFKSVPRIFLNLFDNISSIYDIIKQTPAKDLVEYWNCSTTEEMKFYTWIELIAENSKKIKDAQHLDIRYILGNLMRT